MGVEQIINGLVSDLLMDAKMVDSSFESDAQSTFEALEQPDFSFAKTVDTAEVAEETKKAGSSTLSNLMGIKEIIDMMGISVQDLMELADLESLEEMAQNIAQQFTADLARFLASEVTDRVFGGGGGGMGGRGFRGPRGPGMGMNGGGFRGPRGPGMGMGPMGGGMGGNAPGPGGLLSGIMGAAGGFKAEGKEDGARRRSDVDATTFKGGKLKGFFLFRLLKKLYYCFGLHKLWVKICVKFFQLKRCAKFAFARLVKALPCLIFEFIFDLIALSVIVCLCKVIKPSLPSHPDDDPDADTDDAGMDASAKVFTSQFKHSPEQVSHLFGLKKDDSGNSPHCIILAVIYALWLLLLKIIIILLVAFICCLKSFGKYGGYGYGRCGGYGYGGYGYGGCGYGRGCGGCC